MGVDRKAKGFPHGQAAKPQEGDRACLRTSVESEVSRQVNRGVGSSIPSGSAVALVSRFVTATASEKLAENACGVEETRVAITNTATQTRRESFI